jgi:hypothetical protein
VLVAVGWDLIFDCAGIRWRGRVGSPEKGRVCHSDQ